MPGNLRFRGRAGRWRDDCSVHGQRCQCRTDSRPMAFNLFNPLFPSWNFRRLDRFFIFCGNDRARFCRRNPFPRWRCNGCGCRFLLFLLSRRSRKRKAGPGRYVIESPLLLYRHSPYRMSQECFYPQLFFPECFCSFPVSPQLRTGVRKVFIGIQDGFPVLEFFLLPVSRTLCKAGYGKQQEDNCKKKIANHITNLTN